MSNPTTTGEWTYEYVENLYRAHTHAVDSFRAIMTAHNAAVKEEQLACKDELHFAALQVLERHHQKQLTAERERSNAEYLELNRRYQQLVAERDAEREKVKNDPYYAAKELKQQLAAEREKVAKLHALIETAVHAFKGKLPNPDICERDLTGEALAEDLIHKADQLAAEREFRRAENQTKEIK